MSWMHCRSGCGAHRSCTAVSIEGEHIPECFVCHDPPYTDPWVWGEHGTRRMQCKDIPDATFLTAVNTAALLRGRQAASIRDLQMVLSSLPEMVGSQRRHEVPQHYLVPLPLVQAKARKLIRKGLLDGGGRGYRGDFMVASGVETKGVVARDGSVRQVVVR